MDHWHDITDRFRFLVKSAAFKSLHLISGYTDKLVLDEYMQQSA